MKINGPQTITFALPKGRLLAGCLTLLRSCGYPVMFPSERALRSEPCGGVTFQLFKPRSIPQLIHQGQVEAGFVGWDLVVDSGYEGVADVLDTGLGAVELVVAAASADALAPPPPRPIMIATEYTGVASTWARRRRMSHVVQNTYGSTEGYVPTLADVCIDCVETGDTMRDNGLVVIERLFRSTMRLVVPTGATLSGATRSLVLAATDSRQGSDDRG